MNGLRTILARIWAEERRMLIVGALLTVVVVMAGVLLLGLSGWFITATAAAGLAGTGAIFDVFRPSAAVRLLALGRAAGRYGERLWTHEATLRAVSWLRVAVLRAQMRLPFAQVQRLRAGEALNRLTSDMDLLDLLPLRVIFPVLSGMVVLMLVGPILSWLTTPLLGYGLVLIYGIGIAAASARSLTAGRIFLCQAETEAQLLRGRIAELIRQRDDLAVQGRLEAALHRTFRQDHRGRRTLRKAQHRDRIAMFILSVTGTSAVVFALVAGIFEHGAGKLDAAHAAIAVFVALALAEIATPFQRAFSDLGRMTAAADRIAPLLAESSRLPARAGPAALSPERESPADAEPALNFDRVTFRHAGSAAPVVFGFTATVAYGEVVALKGPSGRGKSTVLALAAGLVQPDAGRIHVAGRPIDSLDEAALRRTVGMLPQRSELLSGTVLDNLLLADPDLQPDAVWAALDAAGIGNLLRGRDGLMTRIGESGRGLSGGERRRIALARVLIRRPSVLLLDEPTEGLNRATAESVLAGVRAYLPGAAIVTASHRAAELSWADRIVTFE